MNEAVIKNGNNIDLIKDNSSSVFTIMGAGASFAEGKIKDDKKIKEPDDITEIKNNSKVWAIWGDNDDWPQKLQADMEKLGVAKRALNLSADLHYGSGIQWMKEQVDEENGTLKHIISSPSNWRRWSNLSGFNLSLSDGILSADTFGMAFIRVTMAADGSVHSFKCLDTPSCRIEKRENGKANFLYYAQDIHEKSAPDEKTVKYKYYDNHGDIKKFAENNPVFVYPIRYNSWGKFYYSEPDYYATFRNGWANIAIGVPKLIENIYKNQASLKYHVKIPLSTFKAKYKDWETKEEKDQITLFVQYRDEIETVITSAEAAGKSVFSLYNDLEKFDSITIEPIKSYLDSTKDLPNNLAANSEILFAIGIDPSLLGLNMPGAKDLNGGGGSQRRESLKIKQTTLTRERLVSLQFAWMVSILNDYPVDIYPMYIDVDISQTLDENPTGKKTVVGA